MSETVINNEKPRSKPNKRHSLISMIDRRLFLDIEKQSEHHPGLFVIASRLADYVGTYIKDGQSTFLDMTLSQALAEWHAQLIDGHISDAYAAYCLIIFKRLPILMGLTVTAKTLSKPHLNHTWDCTTSTCQEWLQLYRLNAETISIQMNSTMEQNDPRDMAFLLCSKVFAFKDLSTLGVVTAFPTVRG